MNWIQLTSDEQLTQLKEKSNRKTQVIFKHSTRCSTSSMILHRLERSSEPENIDFHFLDLISNRSISNKVAEDFKVYHESPQILLIKNGECLYDESHWGISIDELVEHVS